MRDFEEFFSHVTPFTPGCPEPTIIHALREAAIEFCSRMRLWRSDDEFDVSPSQCDVICTPGEAQLLEIEHVTFNGFPLEPTSIVALDNDHAYWRTDEQETTLPRFYTQIGLDTIRIVPAATGKVKIHTILMPSAEAQQVPDWMVEKFARVIAAGALKDLLILPGQPFFNPQLATAFSGRFYSALDDKASLHVQGQQRAPLRTRPQFL